MSRKRRGRVGVDFFIDELIHFFLAALVGVILFLKFASPWLFLVCFLFGFLIDLDHLFDYFAFFGAKFNLRDFLNIDLYVKPSGRVYIPLHGWEYVLVFWLLGQRIAVPGLEWAISISYFTHLLWDNFSFKHHPLAYSFIYRLLNDFSSESFNGF